MHFSAPFPPKAGNVAVAQRFYKVIWPVFEKELFRCVKALKLHFPLKVDFNEKIDFSGNYEI